MKIHLVWDTSGSLVELGKAWIACGVARTLEQYIRLGYFSADLSLIAWGREARSLDWTPDQEFPLELMASKGPVDAKALFSLLREQAAPDEKILLLTDGFWPPADTKEIKLWRESNLPDNRRIIKIGADSNPQLKGKDVFAAEDLFAALDGWLEGGAT
jgi:hypothetical protein